MIHIKTPVSDEEIQKLQVGDTIEISGEILCGRDAVLPKIVNLINKGNLDEIGVNLQGQVIFHTAVSPAGIGPTSSNKLEIEESIEPLSNAGVKIHLGKGALKQNTVDALNCNNAVYAVIPPVTALLEERTESKKCIAFSELGMEALHIVMAKKFPAIIAAAHGRSIYDE